MPFALVIVAVGVLAIGYMLSKPLEFDFGGGSPLGEHEDRDNSAGQKSTPLDTETAGELGYPLKPSPNKGSRNGEHVTTLVWHYTAGASASGAIAWLRNPDAKASAHFVIGRDGQITQLVSCAEAAWHAGVATVNRTSIGVEVVNVGFVKPDDDGGWLSPDGAKWKPDGVTPVQATLRFPSGLSVTQWWVPYTAAQIAAMKDLQSRLSKSAWSACLRDQRGHEDVLNPEGQKTDPGPLFPWEQLVAFNDRPKRRTTVVA